MMKYIWKTEDGYMAGIIKERVVNWRPVELWELLDCGFTSEQIESMAVDHIYRLAFTLIFDRALKGATSVA
jgi:hypothetical protein